MENFKDLYLKNYKGYALDLLKNLISYESVLDTYRENSEIPFGVGCKGVLEYFLNNAKKDGFNVLNVDNYAGHVEFGTSNEILGILGHLDVVPVEGQKWATNPFELTIKDGIMYARGVNDDKGPVVASYVALKMIKDLNIKPNYKVRLIVGCDEESGSRCLERYFSKQEKPSISFSPDADFPGIYGEKGNVSYDILVDSDNVITSFVSGTRYNIVPELAKAKLNIDVKDKYLKYLKDNNISGEVLNDEYIMYGKASHAMCPENGINAAVNLFKFISEATSSKLAKFVTTYFYNDTYGKKIGYYDYDDEMKHLTSNFAVVDINSCGGKIGVNCRIPKDSDIELIKEKIDFITKPYGYSYNVIHATGIHYVSPDSHLMKTLYESYKKISGDNTNKPNTIGGGTYAHDLENSVAFGPLFPGREDVCHIANEYMYESDFDLMVEIYFNAICELIK